MGEKIARLTRLRAALQQTLGREPTIEELATHMDLTPEKVQEIIRASHEPLSMDFPLTEEGELDLGDVLADGSLPAPSETATHHLLKEQVAGLLESLTERERAVLALRYGLMDGRSRTLEEVGREFQVTRERIRQIEARAMHKLRCHTRHQQLQDYLD